MTPILNKFAEFAADKGPALAAFLADNLPAAIQTASDFWTGTLQPAIEVVMTFIQDPVMPIIESLANLFCLETRGDG